jgi:hypothetical protein
MKNWYLFLIVSLICLTSNAQNYEWAKFLGGSSTNESVTDIAVDANGNVYSVGRFFAFSWLPVDFDPGPGVVAFNLPGSYISKLNSNGDLVWARNLPDVVVQGFSIHASYIQAISIDLDGNLVISGTCNSGADLNAGPGVFTLPEQGPNIGAFIAKYSAAGIFMWAKALPITPLNYDPNFPSSLEYHFSSKLATDNESNIIMGITFKAQIDVDPGPDTLLFTTGQQLNTLIIKLTSTGNLIWAKQIFGDIALTEITTNVNDQIYLSGSYNIALFDFQNPSPFPTANLYDGYILKLTENGEFVWVKTMGGLSYDNVNSIKTDTVGNVYCTGSFIGSAWFNNATDSLFLNLPLAGSGGFTAKLDSVGHCIWAKSFGGNTDSLSGGIGSNIEVDSIGNTYTLAAVSGNVVFNAGAENVTENFIGIQSLAIIKHNNNGDLIKVRKADGDIRIIGTGLAIDAEGSLFFNGLFIVTNNTNGVVGTGAIDMDPSSDTAALVGFGSGQDCIFVAKWSQCNAGSSNSNIDGCNNYIWNNDTLSTTGTYTKILTNAAGCDSIAVLNLNIQLPVTASQNIQLCFGDSLVINNNTYTQSGTFQDILVASNGCDSTVTTTLFIDTLQAQINNAGQTLSAVNFPSNATFQWLDCDNNFSAILNQTDSVFYVVSDGNYALLVAQNGCVDTSDCYNVSTVNSIELTENLITVFPNPADKKLIIQMKEMSGKVYLYSSTGRLIFEKAITNNNVEINTSDFATGIYLLQSHNERIKVIIQH